MTPRSLHIFAARGIKHDRRAISALRRAIAARTLGASLSGATPERNEGMSVDVSGILSLNKQTQNLQELQAVFSLLLRLVSEDASAPYRVPLISGSTCTPSLLAAFRACSVASAKTSPNTHTMYKFPALRPVLCIQGKQWLP